MFHSVDLSFEPNKANLSKIFSRLVFFYNGFVLYAARDGQQQRKKWVCLSREP